MRVHLTVLGLLGLLLSGCSGEPVPASEDSDADGFVDAVEAKLGTDPRDNTSLPAVEKTQAITFSESVQIVGTGVPTVQCPADMVNSQTLTWTVAAETGQSNRTWVSGLTFGISGAMTVNDADLFVTGPSGSQVGSATGTTNQETISVGGKQPLGDYVIEVRGCSGAGEVTVTASATVHWIPSDAELLAA